MQSSLPYNKLFVPTVLPLDPENLRVDEDEYRGLIQRLFDPQLVERGLLGLIMNSEAGELFSLDREERRRNVELAVAEAAGRFPVFAGTVGATTQEAETTARDALDAGADGLFVLPPHGSMDVTMAWDPQRYPEVIVDYVKAIDRAAGGAPIIMHPTASRSPRYGIGLPVDVVHQVVAAAQRVVGWKMTYSYEGYRIVARALRRHHPGVAILGASAVRFHENHATGLFDGAVSGGLNYSMEEIVAHLDAWQAEDVARARKIWDDGMAELQEYVYDDYARLHVRYKAAVWLRGLISSPVMRPPMPHPSRDELLRLRELLGAAGHDVRPTTDIDGLSAASD